MNTILKAQEVITRTGNYFVELQKEYEEKNKNETNIYKFIENNKALEIINKAIQFCFNFQQELDIRNEPTQYYADKNPDTPKPVNPAKENIDETNN